MTADVFEYKNYQGSIEISKEDRVLFGKILHIVDLVTYEANTVPELEQAFHESVDDYLSTCADEDVCPDRPMSGTFNVRVGPEIHRRLVMAATRHGLTLNDAIKRFLLKGLDDSDGKSPIFQHVKHEHVVTVIQGSSTTILEVPAASADDSCKMEIRNVGAYRVGIQ